MHTTRGACRSAETSLAAHTPHVAIRLNNRAGLLQVTNRRDEAEPLYRRVVAIVVRTLGPDHPNVAVPLSNLARLLQATNRLNEAEPLSRRHLEIFLKFTQATGHPHPHLQDALDNYGGLLLEMGISQDEVKSRLSDLLRPYGLSLGG